MLEDKSILKVGIRPACDLPNKCRVVGTLDLNYLLCKYKNERFALPLPALSRWFLKVKLSKNPSLKLQNVEKNLDKNDAHISIELFKEFVKRLEPKTEEDIQEINLEEFIEKHCLKYLDAKFERRLVMLTSEPSEK